MEFTEDDIKEFREIWRAEFKENISEPDARIVADDLVELFRLFGSQDQKRTMRDIKKPRPEDRH
jgi:hypothetical protein